MALNLRPQKLKGKRTHEKSFNSEFPGSSAVKDIISMSVIKKEQK